MEPFSQLKHEIECCRRCPRLVEYRERVAKEKRRSYIHETYWGRPAAGFGDPKARLLLVGLAPAAHGANRTGRMFTGDRSGSFLFAALHRAGYANLPDSVHKDDGLRLQDAFVTAAVRCAPPQNKPSREEIAACAPFLQRELQLLTEARVVLCLGGLAWQRVRSLLRAEGAPLGRTAFGHGAQELLPRPWPALIGCYHPSQQNTFTGRLTPQMMDSVLARCKALCEGAS